MPDRKKVVAEIWHMDREALIEISHETNKLLVAATETRHNINFYELIWVLYAGGVWLKDGNQRPNFTEQFEKLSKRNGRCSKNIFKFIRRGNKVSIEHKGHIIALVIKEGGALSVGLLNFGFELKDCVELENFVWALQNSRKLLDGAVGKSSNYLTQSKFNPLRRIKFHDRFALGRPGIAKPERRLLSKL